MLALTKRTEYALIAATHMARNGGAVSSAREIAARYAMRLPLLMNVLKSMNNGGLLESRRGINGGYVLDRSAEDITLADLITAVEGPLRLVRCVGHAEDGPGVCELLGTCPVRGPLRRLHRQMEKFLSQVSVADVAADEELVTTTRGRHETLKVLS
jgi:Rrf2 family protein